MRPTCVLTAGGLIVVSATTLVLPAHTAAPSYGAARHNPAHDAAPNVSGWLTLAARRPPDVSFRIFHALDSGETSGDRILQDALPSTKDLLREVARLSDADDWLAVQRGGVIAKTLDTDSREGAVIGVVRIRGARDPMPHSA